MPQASSDGSGARPLVRPMSPHLQIWRWHVTMLASILHRVTGVGLYLGAIVVTAWLVAVAAGPDAYAAFHAVAAHPLALIVWFGFSLSLFYHLLSGLRHLVWDTGTGLTPATASLWSSLTIWGSLIAAVAFWAWLFMDGKVHL